MIARRLIVGGVTAFEVPDTSPLALTAASAGGWTQASDPHAVYHAGYVYFGYVNGANGNIEVRAWQVATGTVSAARVMHAALEVDTHAAPALIVRDADHKLIAAYSAHNGTQLYNIVSADSLDTDPTLASGFDSEHLLDATILGTKYTYPTLLQLLGETDDPTYLFVRNATSDLATGALAYTKATDIDGGFWSAIVTVWSITGASCYFEIESDGATRIDFAVTDGPPDSGTDVSIYHFYYDGTWRKSDGTDMGSPPFDTTDATLVYDGAGGDAWAQDIDPNGGNPVITFNVTGATPSSHRYARWDGAAWDLTTIVGGPTFADPAPVGVLDHEDVSVVYLDRTISSTREIWKYTTTDNGASFTGVPVTADSADDNLYPATIRHHVGGRRVVWLVGTYTDSTDNAMGVTAGA